MQHLPFYLVDAFADGPFTGNPAAVCPLPYWPDDALLQNITIEHNQSETAFYVPVSGGFELRWFTASKGEINLCGHATLASAHVIFAHENYPYEEIVFHSRFSGILKVRRADDWLTLDFPNWAPEIASVPKGLIDGLGGHTEIKKVLCKRDYLVRLESQAAVEAVVPNYALLAKLGKSVCITAPGNNHDFVSRYFCPGEPLQEDPVTGSAHSMLIPYWAQQLGKVDMRARQLSPRGGELRCALRGDRVLIGGKARTYASGQIYLAL